MVGLATNIGAISAQRYIQTNTEKVTRATQDLASGTIVSNPAFNPSSAAVGATLNSKTQSLYQASRNIMQASSEIQMATGTLGATQDVLSRMKTLATQSNSDTIGADERSMLQKEFALLLQQVDLNAQNARWGSTSLFTGGVGTTTAAGVVAEGATGLTAVANAFAATLNSATQGIVSGIATSANVTANGGLFDVSVVVGNQTFKGTVGAPTGSGTLTLTSTTDSANTLVFDYAAAVTAFDGTAATFQTNLQTLLGVNTAAKAVFSSLGTTAGGMANVTVAAGAGTTAGTWALTYTGAAAGGTGTFKISNGAESYQVQATTAASMNTTLAFSNGITLTLAAFDGTSNKAQELYNVSSGSAVTQSIQYGEKASDVLSIRFDSMTTTSLGLSGISIGNQTNATKAAASIDNAIQMVSSTIATLGGKLSQLNFMVDTNSITTQNLASAKGTFTDTDISEAMMQLQKFKGLAEISRSVFTDALNQQSGLAQMIQQVR